MTTQYPLELEAFGYELEPEFEFPTLELETSGPPPGANRNSAAYIRWVQGALNSAMGLNLAVDGISGPATRSAIRSFQKGRGLVVDGIVGPKTEAALMTSTGIMTTPPALAPPGTTPMQQTVYGWSQYQRQVGELPPDQQAKLKGIGDAIIASYKPGQQPIRKVEVQGHADQDTPRNLTREQQMSDERASRATDWLRNYVGNSIAAQITWNRMGFGATQLKAPPTTEADRRLNRRVEILALGGRAASVRPLVGRCGVPSQLAIATTPSGGPIAEATLRSCKTHSDRCKAVDFLEPKVCLYAAPDRLKDPNGLALFFGMADRWACLCGAIDRGGKVGAASFKTGADILYTLKLVGTALKQQNRKIMQVHVFAHMFEEGIIGATDDFDGLYRDDDVHYRSRNNCDPRKCVGRDCGGRNCLCGIGRVDLKQGSRTRGARTVSDINLDMLDDNVIFVLHACNTAKKDPCWVVNSSGRNFAQALFERLVSKLTNPTVLGHFVSVCAGKNTSWMEYSKRFPTGESVLRKIGPVPYHDRGNRCCR